MGAIPELDARTGEQIRDRHHGRSDNPKGVANAMGLKDFDKGFFGGHLHGGHPLWLFASLTISNRTCAIGPDVVAD